MSQGKGLSYEQRKALYEENVRDRHGNKIADNAKKAERPKIEPIVFNKPRNESGMTVSLSQSPKASQNTEQTAKENKTDNTAARKRSVTPGGIIDGLIYSCKAPDAPTVTYTRMSSLGRFDMPLFTVVVILLVMGVIMMSSASYAYALKDEGDSFAYASRQLVAAIIGFASMLFISRLDYHLLIMPLRRKTWVKGRLVPKENGNGVNMTHLFFLFCLFLMVLVVFMGESVNDAKRWLVIFGVRFQPSEFLKLGAILLTAYVLQRNYDKRSTMVCGFMKYILIIGVCCFFCLLQRHMSALVILAVIILAMMFVGGCNKYGFIIFIALALVGGAMFLASGSWEYLNDRVQSWQKPFSDAQDTTYQTAQSLITIGSGGWFGLGLGNSRQKYYYLPESQNDFVFSIICEELGFFGGMVIILLFVMFAVRGFTIAMRARDRFGSFVALGITLQITLQALLNIGVACNAIPNTGISLPFFSYGRTALVTQLVEAGILLSISRQAET